MFNLGGKKKEQINPLTNKFLSTKTPQIQAKNLEYQ